MQGNESLVSYFYSQYSKHLLLTYVVDSLCLRICIPGIKEITNEERRNIDIKFNFIIQLVTNSCFARVE